VHRSERIHLAVPEAVARTVVRDALALDDTLTGAVPGTSQGTFRVAVTPAATGDGTDVELVAENDTKIPFFGWFFSLIFRFEIRRALKWAEKALHAAVDGTEAPAPLGTHPLSTPGAFDQSQSQLIATVAFAGAITAFAAALFGQLSDPVAKTFHASNGELGGALAVTRLGALIALVAAGLADRVGRRRILLGAVLGVCIASGLSAIAPSFVFFTAAQTVVRACVNAALIVGGIAVIEEAPEGARAFAASMLALAAGAGYALSVILLPIADVGPWAWRIAFGVAGLMALLVPVLRRNLEETRRFEQLAQRSAERGRVREVFDKAYGNRLALLAAVGFLSNVFSAPSGQLGNRYLRDDRHFSNSSIALFKGVTNGVPGIIGIVLAGRLAESRGRRPVAIIGVFVGTLLTMIFFLGSGPVIWIASTFAIVAGASGTLSVGTMDAELFPTEVRGTANALLLVCSVAGSAVGLVLAGTLSDAIGDLGLAIAICGVAPLLAAVFLLRRLPASRGRALDDVSPSEV